MRFSVIGLLVLALIGCGGGGGGGNSSSNANLSALVINTAALVPDFSSNTLNYTAEVATPVTSVTVTPTTQAASATVTVDGNPVDSGSDSQAIALAVGDNGVPVIVTAEDGTARTYTVVITRLAPPSSNADLNELALTVAMLDQIFDPAVFGYTSSSGFFGSSTRVVAQADDPGASLTVNGNPAQSGVPSVPVALEVGDTTLSVDVLASDSVTTQSYQVVSTRGPLSAVSQEAYVKASNPDPDNFGASLAGLVDLLLVGAPLEASAARGIDGNQADNSLAEAGAAYLFNRSGSSWIQTAYLKASNTDEFDRFGQSVAVATDTMVVGATGEQSRSAGIDGVQTDNGGSSVGAVYLYERDSSGTLRQRHYIKASNPDDGDQFGGSLALTGSVLVVGARFEQSAATGVNGNQSDNSLADAGAAYVYVSGSGQWQQAAYVKASNTDGGSQFGSAVALSADTLAISASRENSGATGVDGDQDDTSAVAAGAVYVYSVNNGGALAQDAYLKASNTDPDDLFGTSVSLDDNLLAVGAPGEDSAAGGVNGNQGDNSLLNSGAVYLFERDSNDRWSQVAYIKASNPGLDEAFGAAVALQGDQLVVGAVGEGSNATGINGDQTDENKPGSGAAYVFERDTGGVWSQSAYVKASNTDSQDRFGKALAILRDSVIASAPGEQSGSAGVNGDESDNSINGAGAVYIVR